MKHRSHYAWEIGQEIVNAEARRDAKGYVAVYRLPSNDGGGSFEVCGINDRFHRAAANKLKAMRPEDREEYCIQYILEYTDGVADLTKNIAIEAFLRDAAFNRGPTGAIKMLQDALNVQVDGKFGPKSRKALREWEKRPEELLKRLRAARESYEIKVAGRRANFWKGLVNRWNNNYRFALSLVDDQPMAT